MLVVCARVGGMCQAGEFLADGWFGCVWSLLGDHDYKRDCLGTPNVNSVNCCAHCPANNSSSPWFDFRKSAKWVKECYEAGAVAMTCKLFTIVGVTRLSIYGDWMHDRPLGTCKVSPPLHYVGTAVLRGRLIYIDIYIYVYVQSGGAIVVLPIVYVTLTSLVFFACIGCIQCGGWYYMGACSICSSMLL